MTTNPCRWTFIALLFIIAPSITDPNVHQQKHRQIVIYPYNDRLRSNKRELTIGTHHMDDLKNMLNKILCSHMSASYMILLIWNTRKDKNWSLMAKKISACLGLGVGGGDWPQRGHKENLGWWKCSRLWLWWWLHGWWSHGLRLSNLINLNTSNGSNVSYVNIHH